MAPAQRILIVDDDEDIRASLAELLRAEGYEVEEAVDGQAALDWIFRHSNRLPAMIVLDLMMPRIDGWQFMDILRRYARTARVPVIVISAAREAPPDNVLFLAKPFDAYHLLALIREHSGFVAS
jgi:CheY-like chemotaxis protein